MLQEIAIVLISRIDKGATGASRVSPPSPPGSFTGLLRRWAGQRLITARLSQELVRFNRDDITIPRDFII